MSMIIKYGKKTFNDMYRLYAKDEKQKQRLAHMSEPSFLFRAKDHQDYAEQALAQLGIAMDVKQTLTIITPTNGNIQTNDKVEGVKDGKAWIVLGTIVADCNTAKEFSNRPPKLTIIALRKFNG